MLSSIRKLLDNWIVRAFFIVLIGVFIFWGVSNIATGGGSGTAVATVGGHKIEANAISHAYQTQVNDYAERNGGKEPSQGIRQVFAGSALGQAIDRMTMALEARRLGVTAAPASIRRQVFAISAFNGPDGKFDKATFNKVLAQHELSPTSFMGDLAASLTSDELIQAMTQGITAPKPLVDQLFEYVAQERTIQYVQLPFAAATAPKPPAESVLRRYWRNHPDQYSTPAMRQIEIVVLSPALVASSQPASKAEIAAQYASEKSSFTQIAKRDVDIITAEDAKSAATLADQWKNGADWATMQKAAQAASATAVSFTDAKPDQFPSGRLAKAVFAATPNQVSAPVTGALGTYVFKVTKAVEGGAKPLAAVEPLVKKQVQLSHARDVVDASLSKLQDALAGNAALDKLPGDLHLAAAEGTLDAQGMTADGTPAPIPGSKAVRAAIIKTAFSLPQGAQPKAITGPEDSYYAVSVMKIIPPALKPYDKVKASVLADWTGSQVKRQQEVAAAALIKAVKSGRTFDAAASEAGQPVSTSAPMTRAKPAAGVPAKLLPIIFTLKKGEPTMVETDTGFVVGTVTAITEPKPGSNANIREAIQKNIDRSMQTNVLESFAAALRSRYHVTVNAKMLHQISN